MQLFQGDLGVFHHRALCHFELEQRRIQPGIVQRIGHLSVQVTLAEQATGDIHRHERQLPPFGLPPHHLPARLAQHPGVDFGNHPGHAQGVASAPAPRRRSSAR
ncbi:hypothetical protein WR25_01801 [Diploscapter pachys]|uniref:Uncharacterized protein n=1 Tax=Diploscapter pachys TaxID=2018661 RepID=A0A2A2M5H8_9BILA|nr:hypothetical protein WR25_01801 [Diploscapter pachys]